MISSIILILVIVLSVAAAGLFNGAETGMYRLSRLRLRLGVEKKRLSFILLGRIMHDSRGLLFSMLIGTNLAYYLATSIVTILLLNKLQSEHSAELLATLLAAPLLFVFSELIPKNIFFYRADTLMPYLSPVLFGFYKLFSWCGMVWLLKGLSGVLARLTGSPVSSKTTMTATQQSHIRAILQDTREESFLSPMQTDIIGRLVGISNVSIRAVMTPISKTWTVDVSSDRSMLLEKLKKCSFTRLPVVDRRSAGVVGFINIYDCLSWPGQFTDLYRFVKPIRKLGANTTVIDAINVVQSEKQKIILVTRAGHAGREKPVGIVTMKDLVEELIGELAEW